MMESHSRRKLLQVSGGTVGVGIAGCLDSMTGSNNSDERDASNDSNDPTKSDSTSNDDDIDNVVIANQFDCSDASRPDPDVEADIPQNDDYESVGAAEYPSPPTELTDDAVSEFVENHERVYQQNEFVSSRGESVVAFNARIRQRDLIDDHKEIIVVRLDVLIDYSRYTNGDLATTEAIGEAAVYAVDETGLVRAEADYSDPRTDGEGKETPDPLERGRLLVCF